MKALQILTGMIIALCLVSLAYAGSPSFSGKSITRIDIRDEQGNPWPRPGQVLPLITVRPGDAFSSAAVRENISLLYLKRIFKDIRVDAFSDEGGVRLEFTLFPTTVVEKIVFHGNEDVSAAMISEAIPPLEGRELREEKLPAVKTDILSVYQAQGFYEASVAFRLEPLKTPHRVLLHIDIRESAPTLIEEISLTGNTVFKDKELLAAIKSKKGARLKRDQLLDADMEAILKKYTDAGYPAAKPGPVDMSFRNNRAYVRILGTEGPKVSVRFSGNREFGSKTLTKALLIWSEHDVSDAVLDSSTDRIKMLYREKGYADVAVELRKTEGAGTLDLVFVIQEGPRVTVKGITARGNTVFSTKEIRKQMALRESGWFISRPFREDLLDKDIDYLRDRYLDAGYLSSRVSGSVVRTDEGNEAVVAVEIVEGPLTRTGSISFEGNRLFSAEELRATVSLKQDDPYNEQLVDEDKYRILTAYANRGYLYARVDVDKDLRDGVVNVRYRITEDLPVLIGRIILRGNESTRDSVIMRELLIKTGDFYDYGALLGSQQRIYRLGYFRVAKFEPVHPGEREYVKDMLFTVEERPAGAVEIGAGYGDLDRLRGFVELSHRNLWGTARYSSLRFEQSDILKRAIFNYQEPWLLGRKLDARFSLVWSDTERLNSDTREIYYSTRRTTAAFGIERTYGNLKPSLTYQFENVVNYDVKPAAQLTPEDSGRVLVSSLSPALVWDRRDDVFNPRRGALYGIVLKEALSELASEADFTKVTVQASWFLPLGPDVVTALSARAGMAWPFRDTPEVPLHERFYMGGNTTVRGFTQDSIGPSTAAVSGDSTPLGGASMAVFNIEFRLFPGEGLGFALFTDAGNVWHGQGINLGDLRASYGVGIRYGTPIGPLRIDYGQKIDRLPGESPGEVHFNIGHAF